MNRSVKEMLSEPRRIHMVGIGGIGMAGLAVLLQSRGHEVDGCDERENRQTAWLRGRGIPVRTGHDVSHIQDAGWIIRTTAVSQSHPELADSRVPVHRRGEVLPELLQDRLTIAVSGTHGKTTTAAMIAQILDCGYCIGGEIPGLDGVSRDGETMVVEADESDGTVALYRPDIAVITNIEYDHMEHHADAEAFENCFRAFIAGTKQAIVYCADDPAAARLCAAHPNAQPYGSRSSFPGLDGLSLPGAHNRLNALAAIEVCKAWKTEPELVRALKQLRPVRRRFERVFKGEYTVISDYAHHPAEIRALIQTAHEALAPGRLLGVFQPHRYTRTRALLQDFPPAFEGLDRLWLLPVYAASETPLEGGRSEDLLRAFPRDRRDRTVLVHSLRKAWEEIRRQLCPRDVLLIIGAGDIEEMAEWGREDQPGA